MSLFVQCRWIEIRPKLVVYIHPDRLFFSHQWTLSRLCVYTRDLLRFPSCKMESFLAVAVPIISRPWWDVISTLPGGNLVAFKELFLYPMERVLISITRATYSVHRRRKVDPNLEASPILTWCLAVRPRRRPFISLSRIIGDTANNAIAQNPVPNWGERARWFLLYSELKLFPPVFLSSTLDLLDVRAPQVRGTAALDFSLGFV